MPQKAVSSSVDPFLYQYPALATIVTVRSGEKDNAIAIAWHMTVSREPPYYAISVSPKRYSHQMLLESGEFVVNFMPFESHELVAGVGGCSGSDTDKVGLFGLRGERGSRVGPLVLEEAYAAYECRVAGRNTYGDHDVFVGEVLAVHYSPDAFTPQRVLNVEKVNPNLYLGEDRYTRPSGQRPIVMPRPAAVEAARKKA